MANDRLYLYCKECNEFIMLAKWWGHEWDIWADPAVLEIFLEEHTSAKGCCEVDLSNLVLANEDDMMIYKYNEKETE